jgi:MoxR-like ATPase
MSAVLNTVAMPSGLVDRLHEAITQVDHVVLGKKAEVRLAFTALIAGGHLLLDDLPGMGKTTLARALAATLDMSFQRVQFTSDLMPADIVGMNVLESSVQGGFRFHQGPVFTNLLLADEINRASPRTQSALLEAMAEEQVTIDGHTYPLPDPFYVIATQNPVDLAGTFPLPDSQLDRFLFRIAMGYPDAETELALLAGESSREQIASLTPCLDLSQVLHLRTQAQQVKVERAALSYIQALLQQSRTHAAVRVGLSPRAGIALVAAARAYALIDRRSHVIPDDIQELFVPLAAHRLVPDVDSGASRRMELSREIVAAVKVP